MTELRSDAIWSDAEQATRQELASLYRLVAHFRMTDLVDTHISARIPGTNDFLINRYGVVFDDMRPQDLVRVDAHGVTADKADRCAVNRAGFTIHSAIHLARHDLNCVIHTHTADGIAVACQEAGLLPISQHALKFYKRLGYHVYEGIALDLDERERLVRHLGEHQAMVLRNHGLLAGGRTIAEAFINIYVLERACQAQVKSCSSGQPLTFPAPDVCCRTAAQFEQTDDLDFCEMAWQAAEKLLRPMA